MPTTVTNSAQVNYEYTASNETIDANAQTNTVKTTIIEPGLNVLAASSKSNFGPGEKLAYYIFLSNAQNSAAQDICVEFPLHKEINYIPENSSILYSDGLSTEIKNINDPTNQSTPISGKIISNSKSKDPYSFGFKIGTLEPGKSALISFFVNIADSDTLPNTFSTSATINYTSNPCQFISLISNEVVVSKAYSLIGAKKTVDKKIACCGSDLKYDILLTNSGNLNANNVRIYDSLPAEFSLSGITCTIGGISSSISYSLDENNNLIIPNSEDKQGLIIPAGSTDNLISIQGTVNCR